MKASLFQKVLKDELPIKDHLLIPFTNLLVVCVQVWGTVVLQRLKSLETIHNLFVLPVQVFVKVIHMMYKLRKKRQTTLYNLILNASKPELGDPIMDRALAFSLLRPYNRKS